MRKKLIQLVAAICLTGIFSSVSAANPTANYKVIPLPNEISVQQGQAFILNNQVQIVYPLKNKMLHKAQASIYFY